MTPAQARERLLVLARRAPLLFTDGLDASARAAETKIERATPVDTGASRRGWRVVRSGVSLALVNDAPRARYVLRGRLRPLAIAALRRQIRHDRRVIARTITAAF